MASKRRWYIVLNVVDLGNMPTAIDQVMVNAWTHSANSPTNAVVWIIQQLQHSYGNVEVTNLSQVRPGITTLTAKHEHVTGFKYIGPRFLVLGPVNRDFARRHAKKCARDNWAR